MTDLEIQIVMDDIAKALLKRGMSSEQIREHLSDEVDRIETEISDGEIQ